MPAASPQKGTYTNIHVKYELTLCMQGGKRHATTSSNVTKDHITNVTCYFCNYYYYSNR